MGLVRLAEDGTTGVFNACGPDKPLTWGRVIKACRQASRTKSTPVWMSVDFVAKQDGLEFPIWAPYEGETKGFHTWNNAKAVKAGLRFRPVEVTVKDTLTWYKTQENQEKGRNKLAGPSLETEGKLLNTWKAAAKAK